MISKNFTQTLGPLFTEIMEMIKIKNKKILTLLILVAICMTFSSCSINTKKTQEDNQNNNLDSYDILTNFSILYAGEPVSFIKEEKDTLELTLQIVFKSNVPFTLEFGLIDNFTQRTIRAKEGDAFIEDTIFKVNLHQTGEEFQTSNIIIQVDKPENNFHDLIFFIQNNTKVQSGSIRGYDFLRVNVGGSKKIYDKNNLDTEIPFTANEEENVFLELSPTIEKRAKEINCELQFNINKIYEGEQFIEEYKSHLDERMDFVVMVLEDCKLLTINNTDQYAWSKSKLGENGKITFSSISNTTDREDIVLILVPYPFLDLENPERYQLIAYNNICYYYYRFDESVELI